MAGLWHPPFMTPKFQGGGINSDAEFLTAVERYVLRTRDFYDSRARWHRRFYRLSTLLIIIIGAILPLAAGLDYSYKEVVLGVSGVLIAALTSLRAFYHWDRFWILNRNTEMLITKHYLEWKASNVYPPDPDIITVEDRKKEAVALVNHIMEIRENEAGSFFKVLSDHQDT